MHQSVATIDSPQFINLQPLELNPLMSACEIKVLYLGENRNHSYITKEVATEMAKTLRGAPIVGYFRQDKGDFADHGEKVVIDDQGIRFECMTKPYGFVSPDAQVWFQTFDDFDDFGNAVQREYLMTTGYLWTGQFEECADVVNNGKPHSMELDEKTLDGHWSTDIKNGVDFFIINDAIFSKLCILGDDVEPCFEGSSVTAPKVSNSFNLDNNFKQTLFTMMQDLKNFALGGGQPMENLDNAIVEEAATITTEFDASEVNAEDTTVDNQCEIEESDTATEFKKEEETEAKDEESSDEEKSEDAAEEEDKKENKKFEEKKDDEEDSEQEDYKCGDKKKDYELLEQEYVELQSQYTALKASYDELVEFKANIESAKKDELIDSFYMLSDEDKADVVANKTNYSYDEIEAKLSVICVRKKVSFDLEDNSKNENTMDTNPLVTFNLDETETSVPAYISALNNARKK